jgi:ABC-type polysaccharide/polyol phosphate transport system ATPase subunit
MSNIALNAFNVYKKFKKGELYDSLRDLIPALSARFFYKQSDALKKREFWALRDISFEVQKGDAFGIIGPNGAGKSTILKLLSGIMKPTKGQIDVYGKLSALIEVGAGFHEDLTGRENIFLNGTILGMQKEEIKRKLDEIIDFSGLEDFIDTPVKRYSSGMYARLGFAVAAHVNPDILIVDEVLSVGDAIFQKKCFSKMRSIIDGGATVIFVSHNLKAVAELCKNSLLLQKGQVVKRGSTKDVIQYYLDSISNSRSACGDKQAFISKVSVRDEQGENFKFISGRKAWVDIEVTSVKDCQNIGLVLDFKDDNFYTVFDTSTYRLGEGTFSLKQGEKFKCTFELDMNFAPGSFRLGTVLYRYDTQKVVDNYSPATTVFITSDLDVIGSVNLNPKILKTGLILDSTSPSNVEVED